MIGKVFVCGLVFGVFNGLFSGFIKGVIAGLSVLLIIWIWLFFKENNKREKK